MNPTRRAGGLVGIVLSIVCVLADGAAQAQPTLQPCSAEQDARWRLAWRQLGAIASDEHEGIGGKAAKRWFGQGNWYPVDGAKQALCGELAKWSVYVGTGLEEDVHPYIIPGADYGFAIEDLPAAARRSVEGCGHLPCVWGETTGPVAYTKWLLDDPPLGSGNWSCPAERCPGPAGHYQGRPACMYGPWVMEKVHRWRPEIHPYQAFWSSVAGSGGDALDVHLLHDASGRFEQPNHFAAGAFSRVRRSGQPVVQWQPWAPDTFQQAIALAYETPLDAEVRFVATPIFRDPPASAAPVTSSWSAGGARISLVAPEWLAASHEACLAQSGGRDMARGFVSMTMRHPDSTPARPSRARTAAVLRVTRAGGGVVPSQNLMRQSQEIVDMGPLAMANTRREEMGRKSATLTLDVVTMESPNPRSTTARLPDLRKEWGLEPGLAFRWHVHDQQRLWAVVRYEGSSPEAEEEAEALNEAIRKGAGRPVKVTWSFETRTVDGTDRLVVGARRAVRQYGLAFWGAREIQTVTGVPGARPVLLSSRRLDDLHANAWLVRLDIHTPEQILTGATTSAELIATATLDDGDSRHRGDPVEFRFVSHAPVFTRVEPHVIPPAVLELLVAMLHRQRPSQLPVTLRDALVRDWSLVDVDVVRGTAAQRKARILHLALLRALRDQDLTADEFGDVSRLADRYLGERWP